MRVGTGTCPRDPAVFEACAARLGLAAEPLSPVLAMAGLDNRWTALTDDAGPVVTGLVNTGDSLIHTNPTLGHGVALGLRTAQHLAAHADTVAADPAGYHAWTVRELRPVFDAQVTGDRTVGERLAEGAPLRTTGPRPWPPAPSTTPSSCGPAPRYAISSTRPPRRTAPTRWNATSPPG